MKRELTLTDMDGHMCWWVKADLCSHCAMIQTGEIPGDSVTHCVNSNPIIQ